MFKHILVPTDRSKLSDKAVRQAIKLAKGLGAKITAIHVMPDAEAYVSERYHVLPMLAAPVKSKYKKEAAALAKETMDQIGDAAKAAGVDCALVTLTGDAPYEAIIKQAMKSGCDLIMMASHGRRGLQGVLLGSETQKVLTHSRVPVLVCT